MAVNLKGRSFLTLMDFTPEEIRYMLDLAHDLKAKKRSGILGDTLKGKNILLLFEKTSTRTRCAFETACSDEEERQSFWIPAVPNLEKRSLWRTRQRCSVASLTASSTEV